MPTWTENEIALLGTDTDKAIAAKIDRSPLCVTQKRHRLGIPAFYKPTPTYKQKKWTTEDIALLGTDTDVAIAKKTGRTQPSVLQKRMSLGIPKFNNKGIVIKPFEKISNLNNADFYDELLKMSGGKLTYKSLAALCYVSHSRVQKWFAPKPEPLSMQLKNHFYLAVIHKKWR
jgi:hypothetical protein